MKQTVKEGKEYSDCDCSICCLQVVVAALVIADCVSFMPGNPHTGDDPILQVPTIILVLKNFHFDILAIVGAHSLPHLPHKR